MLSRALALIALALALSPAACGTTTANATTGPDPAPLVAAPGEDAGHPPPGPGTASFCAGTGALVSLPGQTPQCTGDVGKRTFLFAVCACKDVAISGALVTDSLDSTSGATARNGGSIGANGAVDTNSDLFVRGSVWASATSTAQPFAVHASHSGTVAGDLHAGGTVQADAQLTVDGDLFTSGDANGPITCGGPAHVPADRQAATVSAAGGLVREPVSVAAPCDCGAPLDVASIVGAFAGANDDAAAGLTPRALAPAPATTVTLPCGRYYFDAVDGDALHLALTGRTAIFVAGDFHVPASLTLDLAPGAELDLFVTGDLVLGDATLGSPDAPARVRAYVGGTKLSLVGTARIGANVYAPHADVQLASDFAMAGSLFVGSLALSGSFTIHYDESILDASGCTPDGAGCTTCHDCAGATPACKSGACVPCTADADCCAPLVCRAGRCLADIR